MQGALRTAGNSGIIGDTGDSGNIGDNGNRKNTRNTGATVDPGSAGPVGTRCLQFEGSIMK